MAEVKLPLVGGVSKKALMIGGGSAALLVGIIYLRKRKTTTAPAATGTTDPNAIDPNTGLPYGQGTSDYTSPGLQDTGYGPTYGATGHYDPNTGQWIYGNTGTGQAAASTNSQWVQNSIAYLTQNGMIQDPGALGTALGKYILGQVPTAAEEGLIDQAIAVEGYPPVANASGYPPGIRHQAPGGQGGGGGGRLSAPKALHVSAATSSSAQIAWDAVHGATGYTVQAKQGGANGATASGPFSTNGPFANFAGLKPRTHYTAMVWPNGTSGPYGPGSAQPHSEVSFSTR